MIVPKEEIVIYIVILSYYEYICSGMSIDTGQQFYFEEIFLS